MSQKTFKDYADRIMDFFEESGMDLGEERPAIDIDQEGHDRFDPFVPTGHFDYTDNTITLYVSNRQCKDILRTLCHELVHVHQYVSDPKGYERFDKSGSLRDNPVLRRYEAEAYEKGNLLFREWTETEDE